MKLNINSYNRNPIEHGRFHTINGDITLNLLERLNADIYSKSFNGEFYSNYDFEYLEPVVELNETKDRNGATYKINERTGITVGKGGTIIEMETLNGNMYLKKVR